MTIRSLALHLAIQALPFASAFANAAEKSDIELIFRREYGGKPPMRTTSCDLKIKNRRDIPVWYVHPWHVDDRLVPQGRIEVAYWQPLFFEGDGFEIKDGYRPQIKGNVGSFVRFCSLAGNEFNGHFYAFRLPPGAEFSFEGYQFEASKKNVDAIDFLEVRNIRINSEIPLENWVRFPTMADKIVRMKDGTTANDNMNFDKRISQTRKNLRKEPVKLIELDILDRRKVPIQQLPRDRVEWSDSKGWLNQRIGKPIKFGTPPPVPPTN